MRRGIGSVAAKPHHAGYNVLLAMYAPGKISQWHMMDHVSQIHATHILNLSWYTCNKECFVKLGRALTFERSTCHTYV